MAEDDDKDSKTEDPTEKKIQDALEKGQVPFSREIPLFVSLVAFTTYLIFAGNKLLLDLASFLRVIFERAAQVDLGTSLDATNLFALVTSKLILLIAPLLLILMAGGIIASVLQNEPRIVVDRIAPKANRISLKKGWERVFGKQGFVEFLKSVSKLLFAAGIVAGAMASAPSDLLAGMFKHPNAFSITIMSLIERLLISVCVAMALVAAVDLLWSRYSWRENLRMSHKEIKDEYKQAEGDPILKARMRSLARDRTRRRMMDSVPTATLVIANPTHVSVALRFESDQDDAPIVVAKGQDLVALRIREIAKANDIPIFERIDLARALNKQVQVDQVIPAEFYAAVAELIRAIYNRTNQA